MVYFFKKETEWTNLRPSSNVSVAATSVAKVFHGQGCGQQQSGGPTGSHADAFGDGQCHIGIAAGRLGHGE